jgi:amino acid transporter
MTKIIILTLIVTASLLFVAFPKITFKPFSITFPNGWFAMGVIFVGIGVGLIRYQGYKEGAKAGIDGAFKYMKELIKKEDA